MPETLPYGRAVTTREPYRTECDRLGLLLEVSESIASHHDLGELFHDKLGGSSVVSVVYG